MFTFMSSPTNLRNSKVGLSRDGGLIVKLINKTGGDSIRGNVLRAGTIVSGSVTKAIINTADAIGVFYESGTPDGSEAWVVVSGIAYVYYIGSTTMGHLSRIFITGDVGYVQGQALSELSPTSPFASDKHFCEIGHLLESRTGAGLAKTVLHFN